MRFLFGFLFGHVILSGVFTVVVIFIFGGSACCVTGSREGEWGVLFFIRFSIIFMYFVGQAWLYVAHLPLTTSEPLLGIALHSVLFKFQSKPSWG